MKDLIFVCTGNTCRSPMAEGLGKKYLSKWGKISSMGISASNGQAANTKSIIAMDMEGIDIRSHVARRFDLQALTKETLILTMTTGHKDYLLAYYPMLKGQVDTLLNYIGVSGEVSDPFGSGQDTYNQCAKLLKKAILKLDESRS